MKYPTHLVLAGSRVEDEEMTQRLEEVLQQAELECKEFEEKVVEELALLADRLRKALQDVEVSGYRLTKRQVEKITLTDPTAQGYSKTHLGLDKDQQERLQKALKRAKADLNAHLVMRDGKSNFTRFLETVKEETVSDYGLKSAGFGDNLQLGMLVLKGQDALDAEKQK